MLKVQTTSAKNAENGLLRARWSAFWAQQCLAEGVGSFVYEVQSSITKESAQQ